MLFFKLLIIFTFNLLEISLYFGIYFYLKNPIIISIIRKIFNFHKFFNLNKKNKYSKNSHCCFFLFLANWLIFITFINQAIEFIITSSALLFCYFIF